MRVGVLRRASPLRDCLFFALLLEQDVGVFSWLWAGSLAHRAKHSPASGSRSEALIPIAFLGAASIAELIMVFLHRNLRLQS